jgi:hypothetical protein
MPVFYRYVKDNPASAKYPVIGPSVADLGNDPYSQLGTQEHGLDYGNLHKYYRNFNPGTGGYGGFSKGQCDAMRYGSLSYAMCHLQIISATKPIICTEAGYGTNVTAGRQVTPDVQAKYMARMLMLHLKAGIRRTYIYQFADYGTDGFGAFGLLSSDGSEKPAYVELRELMNELSDAAPSGPPTKVAVTLSRDAQDVESVLFEKSDGSYRLILWLEKPAVDPKSNAPLEVPGQIVAVGLPPEFRGRRVLTFGNSGALVAKPLTARSAPLEVTVQDNLTIVDIARSGS